MALESFIFQSKQAPTLDSTLNFVLQAKQPVPARTTLEAQFQAQKYAQQSVDELESQLKVVARVLDSRTQESGLGNLPGKLSDYAVEQARVQNTPFARSRAQLYAAAAELSRAETPTDAAVMASHSLRHLASEFKQAVLSVRPAFDTYGVGRADVLSVQTARAYAVSEIAPDPPVYGPIGGVVTEAHVSIDEWATAYVLLRAGQLDVLAQFIRNCGQAGAAVSRLLTARSEAEANAARRDVEVAWVTAPAGSMQRAVLNLIGRCNPEELLEERRIVGTLSGALFAALQFIPSHTPQQAQQYCARLGVLSQPHNAVERFEVARCLLLLLQPEAALALLSVPETIVDAAFLLLGLLTRANFVRIAPINNSKTILQPGEPRPALAADLLLHRAFAVIHSVFAAVVLAAAVSNSQLRSTALCEAFLSVSPQELQALLRSRPAPPTAPSQLTRIVTQDQRSALHDLAGLLPGGMNELQTALVAAANVMLECSDYSTSSQLFEAARLPHLALEAETEHIVSLLTQTTRLTNPEAPESSAATALHRRNIVSRASALLKNVENGANDSRAVPIARCARILIAWANAFSELAAGRPEQALSHLYGDGSLPNSPAEAPSSAALIRSVSPIVTSCIPHVIEVAMRALQTQAGSEQAYSRRAGLVCLAQELRLAALAERTAKLSF